MNRDEFTSSLVQLSHEGAYPHSEDELPKPCPVETFGNFFGDDFLMLLFHSNAPHTPELSEVKNLLSAVSNLQEARRVRAHCAVKLGRFVRRRFGDAHNCERGRSRPYDWFNFARQLSSIVGALECANEILAERYQKVQFDLELSPLPKLVEDTRLQSGMAWGVGHEVQSAWFYGINVALQHTPRQFRDWEPESFNCALACVVNYLTLLPRNRSFTSDSAVAQRIEALAWIRPLWQRLILAASRRAVEREAYRNALFAQQQAVILFLDSLQNEPAAPKPKSVSPNAALRDGQHMVVIGGAIPPSPERGENDYLKRYEELRKPVLLSPLPGLAALHTVQRNLTEEFPWATEAIALVMNELFARKRHGATRLGMTPILLIGKPGTGKTRFAHRLSDLLGTPNTVINLAGMNDVKVLKGVARGWSSNRPSRMLEFILQTKRANPLFILDEMDKTGSDSGNCGTPQDALLDLLEPSNAKRYHDIYLMSECDLSHCMYIATSNSLDRLSEPLVSRLRSVFFPSPRPEHFEVIIAGILADIERSWNIPTGALSIAPGQRACLAGLAPREMRYALLAMLGRDSDEQQYTHH